ncbi:MULTISPECIES: DMT family transporter [Microbacterium]|uniref:DMT family transporter n=1 Tax=Microbacterium TaxID=33882 RepID=UPI0010F6701E|nr:DMT family transporter [Microbacterium sp. 4NA327F11]MCK9915352.1 DMT family transporter [Microbacteriaceae bacterium K1510]
MLAALLSLSGALLWGVADFLGGLTARHLKPIVVTAIAACTGVVVLLIAAPIAGGTLSAADAAWGAISGVCGVVSLALLYACLAIGPMSILSPLTAIVSAVAPMIWGVTVGGESLGPLAWAGLGVALVAVALVGFVPEQGAVRPSIRGLALAVGAGLAIGAQIIAIDHTSAESGLDALLVSRAVNVTLTVLIVAGMIAWAAARRRSVVEALRSPAAVAGSRIVWWPAAVGGVGDAVANIAMLLALRTGDLSIVAALTALYPAGTIVLAAIVLRERIAPVQIVGLTLALGAAVMLALD